MMGGGGDLVRLQVSRSSGSDGGGRGFSQTAGEQEFQQLLGGGRGFSQTAGEQEFRQ